MVLGWSNPNLIGAFPCNESGDNLEIHAAFLKDYRGKEAVKAGRAAIKWIFENTGYNRVFSVQNTAHTSKYAILCGMTRNGEEFEVLR